MFIWSARCWLEAERVADGEDIYPALQEAINRVAWRIDDRLSHYIERCIDHHRDGRYVFELADQSIKHRILLILDGLNTSCPVDVCYGRNLRSPMRKNRAYKGHVRGLV